MHTLHIIVIALCTLMGSLSALECYSCSGQGNDICVRNPISARTESCRSNQMCYITRTETGSSVSIKRGCKSSSEGASASGSSGVSTSSQTCFGDLCNSGDGGMPSFPFNNFDFSSFNNNNKQQNFRNPADNAAAGKTVLLTPFMAALTAVFNCIRIWRN